MTEYLVHTSIVTSVSCAVNNYPKKQDLRIGEGVMPDSNPVSSRVPGACEPVEHSTTTNTWTRQIVGVTTPILSYVHNALAYTLMHTPPETTILDLGRWGEPFLRQLAQWGYDVTGVSGNHDRAHDSDTDDRFPNPKSRVKLIPGIAGQRLPIGSATFDVVLISGEITDGGTLDEAYRVLKFGGVALFLAPQFSMLSRLVGNPSHQESPGTSGNAMRRLLDRRGIDVCEVTPIALPLRLVPGRIIKSLLHRTSAGEQVSFSPYPGLKLGKPGVTVGWVGWGIKFG